jgi:cytochrome c-type biogenesis protein CcmH/NrfG
MSMTHTIWMAVIASVSYAEVYPVILHGKVVMRDGSVPPKPVAIQRLCSDGAGDAPGPLTDKKGEYIWRMEVDPMRTRACRLEVTTAGFISSSLDISNLNGYTNTAQTLPDLVLSVKGSNPLTIISSEQGVPSKSLSAWKAAMKAVDAGNLPDAVSKLQEAVNASPKFAVGWHTLGIVEQNLQRLPEAKAAYEHAIDADPKMLSPYITLARLSVRAKDWPSAAKASEGAIKLDSKKMFPEVYLHLAVARYGMKDLDAALAGVQEAARMDAGQKRAEYVLGRILEAKGDLAGAKEHMTSYLARDPTVADVELVKAHLVLLGKPEASSVEPELELPPLY